MFSPTDEEAPPMPEKEQPTPDGYPLVPMLGNRLTDIENSLRHIINLLGEKALSPADIQTAAVAGLMALSAARDFLPHLTIRNPPL